MVKNGIVVGRFSGIVVAGLAFVVFWTDTGGTMGCCEGFTEEPVVERIQEFLKNHGGKR